MQSVSIRCAMLADSSAVAELNRVAMGYDYPAAASAEKLKALINDDKNKILVAELNGRVVGYLHLADYDLLYADHMKNIMGIAVSPDCRRMGIGRLLLSAGEQWARETGASAVRLTSGETRKEAHDFYRSCGYFGNKMQLNMKKEL